MKMILLYNMLNN